jgi:hypothetical protein
MQLQFEFMISMMFALIVHVMISIDPDHEFE